MRRLAVSWLVLVGALISRAADKPGIVKGSGEFALSHLMLA